MLLKKSGGFNNEKVRERVRNRERKRGVHEGGGE
jgi:hypothetical protein